MDNERDLPCGNTPAHPLARIRDFLQSRLPARSNDFLQAAARGHIVHPDQFFDYVSCQPAGPIHATQHNWGTNSFESPYDVSDQVLFIAGIIKDIAPDAEISLYRVLADDGSGDLGIIVQAVQDAIQRAEGHPLVINMSLGFAPPLIMTPLLLDIIAGAIGTGVHGVLDADRWSQELRSKSKTDEAYASEEDGPIDATELNELNLAVLDQTNHVQSFDG
ncbi:MAG: hypothetical protein AB7U18_15795, partial [Dehalococcoidia bacterium]